MKFYKKYMTQCLAALMCFSTLSSCDKDFLDKNPLNAISGETFWKTETDVTMALAGVYRTLQNGIYGHRKPFFDTYSDNAYDRHNFFGYQAVTLGVVNPSNVNSGLYNQPYQGIAACNYFLENVGSVAAVSQANKDIYSAEVRFLRAMYYFDLVQLFERGRVV